MRLRDALQRKDVAVRVLLADDQSDLSPILSGDPGVTLLRAAADQSLADAAEARSAEVLLLALPGPRDGALEAIAPVVARALCPVVLLLPRDDPGFMRLAIEAGVSAYHVACPADPAVMSSLAPALRAAVELFRREAETRRLLAAAESRLRERATIDRAKSILIRLRRVTEPEAYRWMRRQAMTQSRRIAEIAEEIVRAHEGQTV